jgi:hypothetical protein
MGNHGGHVIYSESTLNQWESLLDSSETDAQLATSLTPARNWSSVREEVSAVSTTQERSPLFRVGMNQTAEPQNEVASPQGAMLLDQVRADLFQSALLTPSS